VLFSLQLSLSIPIWASFRTICMDNMIFLISTYLATLYKESFFEIKRYSNCWFNNIVNTIFVIKFLNEISFFFILHYLNLYHFHWIKKILHKYISKYHKFMLFTSNILLNTKIKTLKFGVLISKKGKILLMDLRTPNSQPDDSNSWYSFSSGILVWKCNFSSVGTVIRSFASLLCGLKCCICKFCYCYGSL